MARDGSILQRIRSLLTVPWGENNEYVQLKESFINFMIFTFVASPYCIYYFLPGLERVALWLPRILPFTEARLETTLRFGLESYLAYTASMLSLLVLIPLFIGLSFLVSWKAHVAMIKARNISAFMRQIHTDPKLKDKNLSLWEYLMAIAGALMFIVGFYVTHVAPFSEEWAPGRRDWIYFWPFFPLFLDSLVSSSSFSFTSQSSTSDGQ